MPKVRVLNRRRHELHLSERDGKSVVVVRLRPGANDLDAAQAAVLQRSEQAQMWRRLSWIRVAGAAPPEPTPSPPDGPEAA